MSTVHIIDHHNYTITKMVWCMTKHDLAKMVVAFRFFENNYAHPKVDAYDGYDTPTLKPTIPNQDCEIIYNDDLGVSWILNDGQWLINYPKLTQEELYETITL